MWEHVGKAAGGETGARIAFASGGALLVAGPYQVHMLNPIEKRVVWSAPNSGASEYSMKVLPGTAGYVAFGLEDVPGARLFHRETGQSYDIDLSVLQLEKPVFCTVSPDTKLIAARSKKGVTVYDTATLTKRTEIRLVGGGDTEFSPDGRFFVVVSQSGDDSSIALYETTTWQRLGCADLATEFQGLSFSSNGRYLLVRGRNRGRRMEFVYVVGA